MKVIDLDQNKLEDVEVIIGEKKYYIPGDVDIFLISEMIEKATSDDVKENLKVFNYIKKLFSQRHTEEELKDLKLGFNQAVQLLEGIVDYLQGNMKGQQEE